MTVFQSISGRLPEGGRGETREEMSKQPPPAPTESAVGPCPTIIQISRTPRHQEPRQLSGLSAGLLDLADRVQSSLEVKSSQP